MSAGVDFDNKAQLDRIQGGLVPGEALYAVYDMKGGNTGFVGLTDRRVITQDEGRLIQKKRSIVSIPYGQIATVASQDEGGVIRRTSVLSILTTAGQTYTFEFRSSDKAERAYAYIIQHLK